MAKTGITRGDSYNLSIEVLVDNAQIDLELVEEIEFTIGELTKGYPDEVSYVDGKFLFPLSQRETFAMGERVQMQARVQYLTGAVQATPIQTLHIGKVLSEVVL